MSTPTPSKSVRLVLALVLFLLSGGAFATEYAFPVSASPQPGHALSTLEADKTANFPAANAIVLAYIRYVSGTSKLRAIAEDKVYIIYHDGKIAKFKVGRYAR